MTKTLIFTLMVEGSLMGITGMIIALPLAIFLKVLFSEYLAKQSEIVKANRIPEPHP